MVDRITATVKTWLDRDMIRRISLSGNGFILSAHPVRIEAKIGRYGDHVLASVSLPKLLRGHNITDLSHDDCVEALEILNEYIRPFGKVLGLPHLKHWNASSVEFSKTYAVPDPTWSIRNGWHSMSERDAYRFKPIFGPHGSTVTCLGKSFKYIAYDKEAEMIVRAKEGDRGLPSDWRDLSKGKIRIEHVSKRNQLTRTVLKNNATVADLSMYVKDHGVDHIERVLTTLFGCNPFVVE